MKKSWDKKISAVLTATLILTVAPVSAFLTIILVIFYQKIDKF